VQAFAGFGRCNHNHSTAAAYRRPLGDNRGSASTMSSYVSLLFVVLLYPIATSNAQGVEEAPPRDYFEIRIAGEVQRGVPSLGFGRKFYVEKGVSLSPEVVILGVPIICGTIRQDIGLGGSLILTPQLGFGLVPVGLPVSEAVIFGANCSYRLGMRCVLFIESRIFLINKNVSALGHGFLEITELASKVPVLVSLGIGF
jgi:hypothetical protein